VALYLYCKMLKAITARRSPQLSTSSSKGFQTGAHLSKPGHTSSPLYSSNSFKEQQAVLLLHTAQSFDPLAWATGLQPRSSLLHTEQQSALPLSHH
jgi:hypothetical protein